MLIFQLGNTLFLLFRGPLNENRLDFVEFHLLLGLHLLQIQSLLHALLKFLIHKEVVMFRIASFSHDVVQSIVFFSVLNNLKNSRHLSALCGINLLMSTLCGINQLSVATLPFSLYTSFIVLEVSYQLLLELFLGEIL